MPLKSISGLWRSGVVVGLTLGAGGVHAVRLRRSEKGVQVEAAASTEFPPDRMPQPSEIEAALVETTSGVMNEKTRLVSAIRGRESALHLFEPPFDRPEKMNRVLMYTAEPLFLTPIEELVLDYVPFKSSDEGRRSGVVFGARPESVAENLENLALAGLEPDLVLPDTLGLVTAGQHIFKNKPDSNLYLLLDMGTDKTSLALYRQDRPLLIRTLFFGGRDLTRAVSEADQIDLYEAEARKRQTDLAADDPSPDRDALAEAYQPLLREIERTLASASRNGADGEVILVLAGGASAAPGLDRFLSHRLELDVQGFHDQFEAAPPGAPMTPARMSAFGLALLGLQPGYLPNLRRGDLAPLRILARFRVPLALMAAGLILTLAINLGGLFYSYRVENKKHQETKADIERVFRETLPDLTKVVAPLAQMRQAIDQSRLTDAEFSPAAGRVLDVLYEVSRLAGAHEGIRITDLALNPQSLELAGEGGSFEVIDLLKTELAGLPFFTEANLGGARMDPTNRVLTFKISLKRRHG